MSRRTRQAQREKNRAQNERMLRWCREHPRILGGGVLALVVLIVIAAVTAPPKKTDTSDAAGSGAPASTSATPTVTPSSTTSSSRSGSASSAAARVSVAPADSAQSSSRRASDVLAALAVKGRAPKTGYSRTQFGASWTDDNDDPLGGNGCSTREDVLRRDLTATVVEGGCKVQSGTLHDPYTNKTIAFRRGVATSSAVQIDHVVALSDAWQKGAQRYDVRTRTNLANDPLNLLAVDGPTNEAKGDGDAATWLPPNTAYRCAYVARQVAVKARYQLWVTGAEHDAIARVLTACPGQAVPAEASAPRLTLATPKPAPTTRASSTPRPRSTTRRPPAPISSDPPSEVYYENCAAAEAAGAAPIYAGQPGYDRHLDRDGDGIACE